jgi:transposase InsO family protein
MYLFVVVDYYSRYYEVAYMRKITTERTIDVLEEIFARYGYCNVLYADNGRQLCSAEFRNYCKSRNIHLHLTTPKYAQANGEVERQNKSIMKIARIARSENRDIKIALREHLLAYRATVHATTGASPAKLMFGREIRDKFHQ